MSALQELEKQLPLLSLAERTLLLHRVARDIGGEFSGVVSTPGVCGGEPCIIRTRIPVWLLERARRLGHDVTTVAETGHANVGFTDAQVLEFATASIRVVLTFNRRHFIKLHLERPMHAGIIACTYDADFVGLAGRIHDLLVLKNEFAGQLHRVNRV